MNDPYWMTGTRPKAESGTDMSGQRTNGAGVALTPAAAAAIGLNGKGKVPLVLRCNGSRTNGKYTTTIPQLNLLNLPQLQAIKQQID